MGISLSHLIVILLIILLLFGAGKLPNIMSDIAKGLKAFKDELNDKGDNKKDWWYSASKYLKQQLENCESNSSSC